MTVAEFIEYLKKQPQDLMVAYCLYSEYCLMDTDKIEIKELAVPREDGWVHSLWSIREDINQETTQYLVLPGN